MKYIKYVIVILNMADERHTVGVACLSQGSHAP